MGIVEAAMLRLVVIALSAGACATAAQAQVGQFPGVAPPVPSPQIGAPPQLGGAPPPPAVMPGQNLGPNFSGPSSIVTVPNGPTVLVPAGPPNRNSFSDRVERCVQAGTAVGIGPNDIGAFTRQCAN
jgi:glucose/arabinose dehydrogenase